MARALYSALLLAAVAATGCDDPQRKYALDAVTAVAGGSGEASARREAPFPDELVRYLRGNERTEGEKFTLQVEFEPGGFAPRMDTLADIEALLVIMRDYPDLRILLEGHTDSDGDPEKNQRLSQWRADWVRLFLLERGIEDDRVAAEGFGDSRPIADNDTPAGQKLNRRLVLRVLDSGTPLHAGAN